MVRIVLLILVTGIGLSFQPAPGNIRVKGSDTMLLLLQKWAEAYSKIDHDISIQVTGGGSGTGISDLINGVTDICISSRLMTKPEIALLKQRFSTTGVEIPCARDGITIYLNLQNQVDELSFQQLSDIYSGRITNWKQVGGESAPINLYGREPSSGTYFVFKEKVVKTDYSRSCQEFPGNVAVVNAVIRDPNGIGYGGSAFAHGVKKCKVKTDKHSIAYEPNEKTMNNNLYPISRNLLMYTRNRPSGDIKKFIDWTLGPEGQRLVTDLGYFSLRSAETLK